LSLSVTAATEAWHGKQHANGRKITKTVAAKEIKAALAPFMKESTRRGSLRQEKKKALSEK